MAGSSGSSGSSGGSGGGRVSQKSRPLSSAYLTSIQTRYQNNFSEYFFWGTRKKA
jgi:hypothetical protein